MQIQTNDTRLPHLRVSLSGTIEPFAGIQPGRVVLEGRAGEPLSARVTVTPRPEYPFVVLEAKTRDAQRATVRLERGGASGSEPKVLIVENHQGQPGNYSDVIELTTDSPIRPMIVIPLIGRIRPGN